MKKFIYGTIILALFFFSAQALAQGNVSVDGQRYVADEVIVKFTPEINIKKSSGIKSMRIFASGENLIPQESIPAQNITVMKIENGQDVMTVIQDLQNNSGVEYIQPNFIYTLQATDPNDPGFSHQRWLKNIGQDWGTSGVDIQRSEAMDVWSGDNNQNTTGTLVAVIDDGLRYTHAEFSGQLWNGSSCYDYQNIFTGGCMYGFDTFDIDKDPISHWDDSHGTHVAGIIGARTNNGVGVAGTNPWAKIMAIRAGSGGELTTTDIVAAINFAKYNGAKIINASRWWWATGCADALDSILYNTIKTFSGLFVAAAGNDGKQHLNNRYVLPADYNTNTSCWSWLDNIITVAASNNVDAKASFSDYWSNINIAAPGEYILSTYSGGWYEYAYDAWTSMATPFVVAVASLARSMRPNLSYLDIKNAIIDQADVIGTLSGYVAGSKRLNAYTTLKYLSIENISQLLAYTDTGKTQGIQSGWYMSGNQIYFTRMPPQFTGSLSWYVISISWATLTTGWVITTGILLSWFYQEWQYTFSVYPLFTTNATGTTLSLAFSKDSTAPSNVTLIGPIDMNIIGYGTKRFSWSVASDTWAGIGHYLYTIYISGWVSPMITGTTSFTWVDIFRSTGNGYYAWQAQAIDTMWYNSESSISGTFIVNIPQAFSFSSQNNKELSTSYQSDVVGISGLITGSQVSIVWGTYSINTGVFTGATWTIVSGDTIKIQLTSSASYSSQTTAILTIWGLTWTFSITTKAAPSWWGGWWWGWWGWWAAPTIPTCTLSQLICTGWIYSIKPWVSCEWGNAGKSCILTWWISSWTLSTGENKTYKFFTSSISTWWFSAELVQAYNYAYEIGITTIPTIQQADLTGTLIRKHLAKMISNLAIKQLNKIPNTWMICYFTDMDSESIEMRFYSKLACQLGLMGLNANGMQVATFNPNEEVTRAQFGTVLSRTLRGNQYNGGEPFYSNHLNALQNAEIMKYIDAPGNKELRGYVMLMLMRATE